MGDHLDVPLGQRDRVFRVACLRTDERVDPLHRPERDAGDERVVPVLAREVGRGRGAALPGALGRLGAAPLDVGAGYCRYSWAGE
jgi:hypothetical protein